MKIVLILLFLALGLYAIDECYSATGTCASPPTRTNSNPNDVLTSTKYNADLNTIYSAVTEFDASCSTVGSLEKSALNTTEFEAVFKGTLRGCEIGYTDENTISIAACSGGVGTNLFSKSTATSLAMGCVGCSAEATATKYYVLVGHTSSAGTLNAVMSVAAPDTGDGLYSNGSKLIGTFYNNSDGKIEKSSINQFRSSSATSNNGVVRTEGGIRTQAGAADNTAFAPVIYSAEITASTGAYTSYGDWIFGITALGTGNTLITLHPYVTFLSTTYGPICTASISGSGEKGILQVGLVPASNSISILGYNLAGAAADYTFTIICMGFSNNVRGR